MTESFFYHMASIRIKHLFSSKQKIPDTFISTSFKKHCSEIMNERKEKEDFSMLFCYLPSITDRKE